MARENNFLIGRGEALTYPVTVKRKSEQKNLPYQFEEARDFLAEKLTQATDQFSALPPEACPKQEVVAVATIHPRYIAKSDFPSKLFEFVGIRPVGSRLRILQPRRWGTTKPPRDGRAIAEDVFLAGTREAFARWTRSLPRWTEEGGIETEIQRLEDFAAFSAASKLRNMPRDSSDHVFEVVLHNDHNERPLLRAFESYAQELKATCFSARAKSVRGLTFMAVRANAEAMLRLSQFSFVRVARPMPRLRPLRPSITRTFRASDLELPEQSPQDVATRVVIFDGGIPHGFDFRGWVRQVEPVGIGEPDPEYQEHGLAVTSALLFGSINGKVAAPLCYVDHVRVLDKAEAGTDLEYPAVLERILAFIDQAHGHEFFNISLGPQMAMDDDEVTQWTACLDDRFAKASALVSVAAGNDGELDSSCGLNRIQPPADGVNVLSVGACDSAGPAWRRASYSCVGPGRTPGIVKPDGLSFGGSQREPFGVLSSGPTLKGARGTSVAAPFALRSAVAVRAQLGAGILPLTIRALMIHRAEYSDEECVNLRDETGWGRFLANHQDLITCDDNEALVVFQGELPVGGHLRAPIPLPDGELEGSVGVTATLVIAPTVDPEHAGAYTRSGVLVTFRPDATRFTIIKGKVSQHAKSEPFFSTRNMYSAAEFELREDGQKWEPCIKATKRKRSASLVKPVFDIQYQHREGLGRAVDPKPIPYALIIGLRTPNVQDLYNRVLRTYANVLIPIQPRLRLPIQT